MKTKILFIVLPLLAAITAHASAIENDLAAVNAEFGVTITKEELGKVLDHCGANVLKEFDIGTHDEPHSVLLNPLTYLAHKASVDTLWILLQSFEKVMAPRDPATKRDVRFKFYDMLVRAMVQGKKFKTLHDVISRDKSQTQIFAVTVTRRLILALIEEENTFVLDRLHNESNEPNKNERSLGTKYPNLYKCQPAMAKLFNSSDMRLFVVRDLVEELIKTRGAPNEQNAKDMLKFYMSFYSDWKTLPIPRKVWAGPRAFDVTTNLIAETHQKFPDHFEYVMEVLKVLRAEVVDELTAVVPAVVADLPESPIRQPSAMKKSTSFVNSPPLVRHKRPAGNATPTKSILKRRDSASESSSRDITAVTETSQKKAKPLVEPQRMCSDIGFILLGNHPDEFIVEAMAECESAGFCTINDVRIPTLGFLMQKGRFALVQKLAAKGRDLGLNDIWQAQTVRELLFSRLLTVENIGEFLINPNLAGDKNAKASLLLRLSRAYLAQKLSNEEFERLVMTEGVFTNALCVEEIEGGEEVSAALLARIRDTGNQALLLTVLRLQSVVSQAKASLLAYKELMKAADANDLEKFNFWASCGLIDLNGKEYDFAE